ncbi:MAG: hypothetical protein H6Q30_1840 [Bacteroidetes bacterium]|nr:hypothetical protein [Bacteroidota bacterium]
MHCQGKNIFKAEGLHKSSTDSSHLSYSKGLVRSSGISSIRTLSESEPGQQHPPQECVSTRLMRGLCEPIKTQSRTSDNIDEQWPRRTTRNTLFKIEEIHTCAAEDQTIREPVVMRLNLLTG